MFLLSHSRIYTTPDGGRRKGEGDERRRKGEGDERRRKRGNKRGKRRGGGNGRVSREKGSCMVHLPLHT